jgi:hypothetical protein
MRYLLVAVTLTAVTLTACYSPDVRECTVSCNATTDCVAPHVCGADGLCASTAAAGHCAARIVDGGISDDAALDATTDGPVGPPVDSPVPPVSLCISSTCAVAGGSCVGDRCVIDRDTDNPVTCPAGMPCTVICNAQNACKKGVKCGNATSCIVECTATAACQDKGVDCGMAATCDVTCRGSSACQHGPSPNGSVDCRAATCDVTCDGSGACQDGIRNQGTCTSHCCNEACEGGTGTCTDDSVCS